jgi:hypothetical protein
MTTPAVLDEYLVMSRSGQRGGQSSRSGTPWRRTALPIRRPIALADLRARRGLPKFLGQGQQHH